MSNIRGDFNVSRNSLARNLSSGRTTTTTTASTLTLSSFSTTIQSFIGSIAGQIVNLGDATGYPQLSIMFLFINDSDNDVTIKNYSGSNLNILKPKFSLLAILESNSTQDGVWRFCQFIDKDLEYIANSASPGWSFGRSGAIPANTWLLNDTVASNISGRLIDLTNAKIRKILITNENVNSFVLGIYEHDSITYTQIATVAVTALRVLSQSFTPGIAVTTGKELAIKIESGSCKNIVVGLIIGGSII